MRAALLRRYGAPAKLAEWPDPNPGPGQTLVHVTAAPIVPLDLLCATGTSYFGQQPLPYVPGVQGVGTVSTSADLPAGSRVWFATSAGMAPGDGSLAELCPSRWPTWSRLPATSRTPPSPPWARRESPRGWRSAGGQHCKPANGSSSSGQAALSVRPRWPSPGT